MKIQDPPCEMYEKFNLIKIVKEWLHLYENWS